MTNYDSDYEIRLATLGALGGDTSKQYDSVYEIDLEILRLTEEGAGPDIQTVTSLPSTQGHEGEFFRLESNNKVYVATYNDNNEWVWAEIGTGGEIVTLVPQSPISINQNVISVDLSNYYNKSEVYNKTEVDEKIATITNTENADLEEKSTIDFTFVNELPASGEENQCVIIQGENQDTLYKYVSGAWVEQTPDANSLYFDTEGNQLYSYVSAEHQFAPISTVDTIIVSGNLNSNAALKQIKTAGNYNVLQHLTNATRGSYLKNWVLTVQAVDYDEYDSGDSVYQKLENNVTIYKRTWSGSRQTNDGWTTFSTYYEGLVKDTATSKYYTWSSNKLSGLFDAKQDTLSAGYNITISDNTISANNTIEEVSALPEASENKDKLFRLDNGDKDVYASKLESSVTVTTNKLPDEQQIDKAYLYENLDSEPIYYYKGEVTIVCSDGQTTWYKWYDANQEGCYWVTEHNAENVTSESLCYWVSEEDGWTLNEDSFTNSDFTIADFLNSESLSVNDCTPIPATYNAPEANQIGNAYLKDDITYYYTGVESTVEYNGEQVTGYKWEWQSGRDYLLTTKKSSEFYYTGNYNDGFKTDVKILSVNGNNVTDYFENIEVIYIPQLNAPDSEQVNNAYIEIDTNKMYYKGEFNVQCSDGNLTMYAWLYGDDISEMTYVYLNKIPASNIYDANNTITCSYADDFDYTQSYPFVFNGTIADFEDAFESESSILTVNDIVKYQRTETTETWGWGEVINEDYVPDYPTDAEIDELFPAIVRRVLMKDSERYGYSLNEGLINVNDETIEFEGQTYYKWLKSNDYNGSQDYPTYDWDSGNGKIIILTTSLEPTLPFTKNSPEYAFTISENAEDEGTYDGFSIRQDTFSKEALEDEDGNITYRT